MSLHDNKGGFVGKQQKPCSMAEWNADYLVGVVEALREKGVFTSKAADLILGGACSHPKPLPIV